MTSSNSARKRRRDNGLAMPRLREVIDGESGEVYHVETTREAKRRHKRNAGAQYQPTVGQLNAADIWNRQEEKIKKDKEREEKKKRNKIRDAAKDARLKELQQEDLRKGRISIEDTWGKVNASQNRLHRFFGQPTKIHNKNLPTLEEGEEEDNEEKSLVETPIKPAADSIAEQSADEVALHHNISVQELQDVFTTSPLSPGDESQVDTSVKTEPTSPTDQINSGFQRGIQTSSKRKHCQISQPSQITMPPPKRRLRSSSYTEKISNAMEEKRSPDARDLIASQKSPLAKMTESEVDARSVERSQILSTLRGGAFCLPSATQIARDTLSGLCSQDLADDFLEKDKGNQSPPESRSDLKSQQSDGVKGSGGKGSPVAASFHDFLEELSDSQCRDILDGFESDEFDDEGLDDESLLALAVTEQLKNELFTSSKHDTNATENKHISGSDIGRGASFSERRASASGRMSKLSDSFAMDGLSDEDLLEGLENFENANRSCCIDAMSHGQEFQQPKKKRRDLPWIKYPISYSQKESHDCNEKMSPLASCGKISHVLFGSQ